MKKIFFMIAASALLAGCELDNDAGDMHVTVIESFERSTLGEKGYELGYPGDYLVCEYGYNEEWGSWNGFAVSKLHDMQSAELSNQYSVYNEAMASGDNCAVFYYDSYSDVKDLMFRYTGCYSVGSVKVNLSTYTWLTIRDGNSFARKFDEGDYLKVSFTALLSDRAEGETVDFYAVDYRDGKRFVADDWNTVDLSRLKGDLWGLRIRIETTDVNEYGACTPLYVCLDDLTFSVDF